MHAATNAPEFDAESWAYECTRSRAHAYIKLIVHTLRALIKKGAPETEISDDELARFTSLSTKTVQRYRLLAEKEGWIEFNAGRGRSKVTTYRISVPMNTLNELASRLDSLTKKRSGRPVMEPENKSASPTERENRSSSPSTGASAEAKPVGAENVPPHPPKINPSGYNTPLTPQRPRSRRDPFGLNATLQAEHQDVWFDGDDRLQVANGFEAELLEIVGGRDQLRIELDCATERIGPKTPGTVLKAKVRGQIQKQLAIRRDQDRRYAEGAAKRQGKPYDSDDEMRRRRELMKLLES